jgi:hypothetical protein
MISNNSSTDQLSKLASDIDDILARLTRSKLGTYDSIQKKLLIANVASDRNYQKTFAGFYKVRRAVDWRQIYFSLLEDHKRDMDFPFLQAAEELFTATGKLEISFSSKLIATIRPQSPVYDSVVGKNIGLELPSARHAIKDRLRMAGDIYDRLSEYMNSCIQNRKFDFLRLRFDERFPEYRHFTDIKKLDLLFWQYRP